MKILSKLSFAPKKSYQSLPSLFKRSNLVQASQHYFSNVASEVNEVEIPNSLETQGETPLFKLLDQDPTNQKYKSALKVMTSIQKEWKYEMSESNYLPRQETLDYLRANGYTWIEEPRKSLSILQKTTEEYLVELKFLYRKRERLPEEKKVPKYEDFDLKRMSPHQKNLLEQLVAYHELEAEEEAKRREMQGLDQKQFVQIEIMNNRQGSKLYFLASIADGEVHLQHVMLFSNKALATGFKGLKLFNIPGIFKGVNFHALSEGVQRGLLSFIEGLGIEPEVFYHIEYLALNREQRLYLELLKNIHDFAKKDLLAQKERNGH